MILLSGWNNNNAGQIKTEAMTTMQSYPPEITLSENLRNFLFSPVEAPTTPQKASLSLSVNEYVAVGETITFVFGSFTIVLTASATPSVGEFYTAAVAPSPVNAAYLAKVAESIASTLNQILSVNNSYKIDYTGSSFLIITAKDFGDSYNISATSTSANVTTSSVGGVVKYLSQSKIDYSAWAVVCVGSEAFARQVYKSTALEVDRYTLQTAKQSVDLAVGVVGDYVKPILPIKKLTPSNDFNLMESNSDGSRLLVPYFVIFGDEWREVVNGQKKQFVMGVSPVRWVQLGSVDSLRPYDMNEFVWIPTSPNSFNWLSSAPEKEVTYKSHEYLQLICKYNNLVNINFNIEIKCNFYDGTSLIVSKPTLSTGPTPYLFGNASFDVSPLALGLEAIETANAKLIDSYTIKLKWTASGSVVGYSQPRTYKFQRDCNDKSHQIMFLNEFGAWDCIEFRGENQSEIERNTSVINRVLPPNANKPSAINHVLALNTKTETTENTTIHSGLLKADVYEWSKKLFKSAAIYLWNEDLADYEAINIVDYDYGFDSKQGGGSISITYNRGQDNNISQ